jgi:hypothetical protein
MSRIVKGIKTLPWVVIGLVLLTGTWLLGTPAFGQSGGCGGHTQRVKCIPPLRPDVRDRCCQCFGNSWLRVSCQVSCRKGYMPTAQGACVPDLPKCPEGYHRTASGACVKPLDPCEQCDSLFKECEGKVSQGVDECKTEARKYATDICGSHLDECTGNPISIWLDEDPPIICQGELTVDSDIGWIYCDGKQVGHRSHSWIICRAPFEPGKAWTELPRCINAKIDHCIGKCLLSDAGTAVTLNGSTYGFSAGVSVTLPPHTGYNAGCITLGRQAYDECANEKQKCQEACRPSGPSTITPGPRR